MRETQLVDGCIPPHTECPFHSECQEPNHGWCAHTGKNHTVPFSCGFARAFDICKGTYPGGEDQRIYDEIE